MSLRLRYRESRQNHRPLFFAKFFALVANATSVGEALGRLIAPNLFVDWAAHVWPSSPRQPSSAYRMAWYRSTRTQAPPPTRHQRPSLSAHPGPGPDHRSSSTAPPVVSPFDFVAYGAPRPPCHRPCPLPPSRASTAHTCPLPGYGSCSAWATFVTYVARAVGVPARQELAPDPHTAQTLHHPLPETLLRRSLLDA